MLHPSYTDLINAVNSGAAESGDEPVVQSRYSIVIATAKRARQIIAGDEPLVKTKAKEKPLSIAVRELNEGQIRILTDEETERKQDIQDLNLGIMRPDEYRMKWYGEDEKTAKKNLPQSSEVIE